MVSGQQHSPAVLYPRERPGTHCTGGWVGPRVSLDRCGKSRPTGIFFLLQNLHFIVLWGLHYCFFVHFLRVMLGRGVQWVLSSGMGVGRFPRFATWFLCVCVLSVLFGGWCWFFSLFAVSCHLVVWLSSIDCSSCVEVRLCQDNFQFCVVWDIFGRPSIWLGTESPYSR